MKIHMAKMIWHQKTEMCNWDTDIRLRRRNVEIDQRAGDTKLILYGRKDYPLVEGVTNFQYLGRMLKEMESDWLVAHCNTNMVREG